MPEQTANVNGTSKMDKLTTSETLLHLSHLGDITVSYALSAKFSPDKPTLLLINSFATCADLFRHQFADEALNGTANLLAIEPLGHGNTRAERQQWTYWDSALISLMLLEKLELQVGKGKGKVFALGVSQGGFIVTRMALLAPEKFAGIIPVASSMDTESERSRALGCWDASPKLTATIKAATCEECTPDWTMDDATVTYLIDFGYGKDCSAEDREFWAQNIHRYWGGDDGRRRVRMSAINLRDRDGLHGRLADIRIPVLWLHGTQDDAFSAALAQEEIKFFTHSPDATLKVIDGGLHHLNYTSPKEVNAAVVDFIKKYEK